MHAVGMEFVMDKCVLVLKRGRFGESGEEKLVDGSILKHVKTEESYAYLEVQQRYTYLGNTVKEALCRN